MIQETCFWCDQDLSEDWKNHKCSGIKEMTKEECEMGTVLIGIEFCDHFCCGFSENVCKAKALVRELNRIGWKKS